jgi:hypothetical protein
MDDTGVPAAALMRKDLRILVSGELNRGNAVDFAALVEFQIGVFPGRIHDHRIVDPGVLTDDERVRGSAGRKSGASDDKNQSGNAGCGVAHFFPRTVTSFNRRPFARAILARLRRADGSATAQYALR